MTFNDVDPAPFRNRLSEAGFYKEWRGKFGDEAWGLLEEFGRQAGLNVRMRCMGPGSRLARADPPVKAATAPQSARWAALAGRAPVRRKQSMVDALTPNSPPSTPMRRPPRPAWTSPACRTARSLGFLMRPIEAISAVLLVGLIGLVLASVFWRYVLGSPITAVGRDRVLHVPLDRDVRLRDRHRPQRAHAAGHAAEC